MLPTLRGETTRRRRLGEWDAGVLGFIEIKKKLSAKYQGYIGQAQYEDVL